MLDQERTHDDAVVREPRVTLGHRVVAGVQRPDPGNGRDRHAPILTESLGSRGLDSTLPMTGSKADRPYGAFPRHGVAPVPEPPPAEAPRTRRGRIAAWLRARTRRERLELVIT